VLEQPVIQMLRLRRLRSRAGHKEGIVELAELVGESVEVAQRRERLLGKGRHLEARDERDRNRAVAPLKPAEDALLLDNSGQTIAQSVDQVLTWWEQRQPFQALSGQPG
jgi:hypothetical protein